LVRLLIHADFKVHVYQNVAGKKDFVI